MCSWARKRPGRWAWPSPIWTETVRIDVVQSQGEHPTAIQERIFLGRGLAVYGNPPLVVPTAPMTHGCAGRRQHTRPGPHPAAPAQESVMSARGGMGWNRRHSRPATWSIKKGKRPRRRRGSGADESVVRRVSLAGPRFRSGSKGGEGTLAASHRSKAAERWRPPAGGASGASANADQSVHRSVSSLAPRSLTSVPRRARPASLGRSPSPPTTSGRFRRFRNRPTKQAQIHSRRRGPPDRLVGGLQFESSSND